MRITVMIALCGLRNGEGNVNLAFSTTSLAEWESIGQCRNLTTKFQVADFVYYKINVPARKK